MTPNPIKPSAIITHRRFRHRGVIRNGAVSSTTIRRPINESTKNSSNESEPSSDNTKITPSIHAICA